MNDHEQIEKLRAFAINHGLPKTDMALYDVRCPYCGKSDRIRLLETPEELGETISTSELDSYEGFWRGIAESTGSLGVCKFCQHIVKLGENGQAEPLTA